MGLSHDWHEGPWVSIHFDARGHSYLLLRVWRKAKLKFLDDVQELLLAMDVRLAVDVGDVRLCRALGNAEPVGNMPRVPALHDVAQHLALARRELVAVYESLALSGEVGLFGKLEVAFLDGHERADAGRFRLVVEGQQE